MFSVYRQPWFPAHPRHQVSFAGDLLYSCVCILVKLSVLHLYLQVAQRTLNKTFARFVKASMALCIISDLAYTLALILACRPVQAFWFQMDPVWSSSHDWHCTSQVQFMSAASIAITVMDFLVAFLPIHFFLQLRLAPRQKIILIGLFAVGSCSGLAAMVRSYYVSVAYHDIEDWTWHFWYIWIWTVVELAIGITCACAPAMKAFYIHCGSGKATLSTSTSSQAPSPDRPGLHRRSSSRAGLLEAFRRASSACGVNRKRMDSIAEMPSTTEISAFEAQHAKPHLFAKFSFTSDTSSEPPTAKPNLFAKFSWMRGKKAPEDKLPAHGAVEGASWDGPEETKTRSSARPVPYREESWQSLDMGPEQKVVWDGLDEGEKGRIVRVKSTVEVVLEPGRC